MVITAGTCTINIHNMTSQQVLLCARLSKTDPTIFFYTYHAGKDVSQARGIIQARETIAT